MSDLMSQVKIAVDSAVGAAYMTLNDRPIFRTVEANEYVCVDLDEFDVVVGIELLDVTAGLPLTDLCHDFHLPSEQTAIIRKNLGEMIDFIRNCGRASVRQTGAVRHSEDIEFA